VRVTSEYGDVLERFGEMSRKRAWAMHIGKCRYYESGVSPISGGNPITPEDLEEGLPDDILGMSGFGN